MLKVLSNISASIQPTIKLCTYSYCDKKIVLEWRMKKHKILHEESASIKYCHYFNNKKECPYDKIGCMFRHNQSRECKFGKHCHIQLCQFQHSSNEENEKEITHEEKDCFSC